jgi:hypothetical protein
MINTAARLSHVMKISGPKLGATNRVGQTGSAGGRAAGGQAFAVQGQAAARESAPSARTAGLGGVSSVDALLALQQLDGPLERRRRATGRANRILDVLDEVKLALLEGGGGGSLDRLVDAVRQERSATDDPRLEGVLDEIETRAAVELAKREARAAA